MLASRPRATRRRTDFALEGEIIHLRQMIKGLEREKNACIDEYVALEDSNRFWLWLLVARICPTHSRPEVSERLLRRYR